MIKEVPGQKFSPTIQEKVRQQANYLCEYCHACEQWQYVRFSIDHIIPLNQGGTNQIDKQRSLYHICPIIESTP